MEIRKRQPIGIELVKRGLVTESNIEEALEYQRKHPSKKIGDILNILGACDSTVLIQAIGDILGEKGMLLSMNSINIRMEDYMSLDIIRANKAIPFDVQNGKVKVCFASISDKKIVERVRLLLLNKGLIMEKYITFEDNIDNILKSIELEAAESINTSADTTALVDSIIKNAMEKRASDIHIEPLEKEVRIRYRIDGELYTAAMITNDKQAQIIGRIKAISNMHQEKQEAQDGRIIMYPDYNIRVSSQKNVYGEKLVLRLLKKNMDIRRIFELGFPNDENLLKKSFNKRNSITVVAAPTGEGKTTTLYSIIDYLDRPEINITTIEDPVEIRIPGLNQIEIDAKTTFSDSLRTVLRQDPDIILVGEVRDNETAEIAIQAGQTGHYVLATIHTIDSVEVITRLRKMGVSNYDISSTLATSVSQRLVRRLCPDCSTKRAMTQEEKKLVNDISAKYNVKFEMKDNKISEAQGCSKCNYTGYYDRIGIFEVLILSDVIKEAISDNKSSIEIRKIALEEGEYKPLVVDGIQKVLDGITTFEELNRKIVLY